MRPTSLQRGTVGMGRKNTQARIKPGTTNYSLEGESYSWKSYGDVTHISAAASHAEVFPFQNSIIETRWEGHETIFQHKARACRVFEITPLRKGS